MLGKYVLFLYVKLFLIVNAILLGIVSSYALMELLFLFKQKSADIAFSYLANLLPLSFLYLSPFSSVIAMMILLRYVFLRKIDLIVQSFGISPLKFFLNIVLFLVFVSFFNFFMNFNTYAENNKNLYSIEKRFKKRQEIEDLIVRNAWFFKEENDERIYINFQFVDIKGGKVAGVFLVRGRENNILEIVQADRGLWKGDTILLPFAKVWNFKEGNTTAKYMAIKLFDIKNAQPIGERVEHVSLNQLIFLYFLGKSIGLNYNLYMSEIIRRFLSSFTSVPIGIIVMSYTIKRRNILAGLLSFVPAFFFYWMSFVLTRLFSESMSLSPIYGLIAFAPLFFFSLKGLYYLGKGFRV
ncbi:LptF/LptG family permease [Hydrogenobacter thermophilus]|uniref:LptF/LptG family permease n=1 Tax=Hydrogenobacter thermophilus TaxID=940 RepID=UPI0030FB92B1